MAESARKLESVKQCPDSWCGFYRLGRLAEKQVSKPIARVWRSGCTSCERFALESSSTSLFLDMNMLRAQGKQTAAAALQKKSAVQQPSPQQGTAGAARLAGDMGRADSTKAADGSGIKLFEVDKRLPTGLS